MKKLFKIIIPILLTLLILVSIVWYCFVYDRTFTRDMLLSQARYLSVNNKASTASWFYDRAYELSDEDESVAIELANQFKADGNFTKAEYTLSHAIADGGDAKVYIALCKTYVQQDKLLDAVTMLDNISDPAIKAELDAMRPAAPAVTPEPGFYNEYISVALTGSEGNIYYSTNNEYPSTEGKAFSEPIALDAGETTIRAVAVAPNGLVSPLTTHKFTIGGVIEEVSFTDTAIEASVREMLSVDADKVLFTNDLWNITSYTIPEGAMNLQDIALLPYLKSLSVSNQTLDSVSFLATLSHLEELNITDCRFSSSELEIIAALPALKHLTLSDCGLSTIAGLENARNLETLNLRNNTIRNLAPLSALLNLKVLDLNHNAITGLADLSVLANLETLDISYNSVTSLDALSACLKLQNLNASHNRISGISSIGSLSALNVLNLANNNISDISYLAACPALVELDISKNTVSDLSALSVLTNLEIFNFANNQATALPQWGAESRLRSIDGSYNQIESISLLGDLQYLTHIFMDYNAITNIDAIADCFSLVQINVYGNEIENVDALKEHEIIVNWDPTAAE